MGKFFLAFTLIPLVELALLIKIGQYVGPLPTILLVVITGGVGVFLAKNQGLMVLSQIQHDLNQGIMPGNAIVEGLLVLIGSVLLITPGLITDVSGFLLLLPFSRIIIREFAKNKLRKMLADGRVNVRFGRF